MTHRFPTDRLEKRRALLDAVESIREAVAASADESEALGTLAPAAINALASSGLWGLKSPLEVGGADADPVTQIEIIEAMAYHDTSTGWAMMIGATSAGWPGAFLPAGGAEVVFKDGIIPTVAGSGGVGGTATAVKGGYRISGRYAFASGARHARWMLAGAPVVNQEQERSLMFLVSVEQAVIHLDTWDVAGLKGTGSCDFSIEDVFVPAEFTWDRTALMQGTPERGGPIFRLGMPAFTANEHPAFALGCARRALDLITEQAKTKKRGGGPGAMLIADRAVFQRFLGESDQRLKAAKAHVVQVFERAWQTACAGAPPEPRQQAEIRAACVYATEAAVDVATNAFRYAGGGALQSTNLLQRIWRDVTASAQHQAVSNAAFEAYGLHLLGMAPEPPSVGGNARA